MAVTIRQLWADATRVLREQSPFSVVRPIHFVTGPSIRYAKVEPASSDGEEMESRCRLFGCGIRVCSSSNCLHKTNELPMCFPPLRFTTAGVNLSVNYGRRTPTHIRPVLDAYAVLPQPFPLPQFANVGRFWRIYCRSGGQTPPVSQLTVHFHRIQESAQQQIY
jgi:hypothetical protein